MGSQAPYQDNKGPGLLAGTHPCKEEAMDARKELMEIDEQIYEMVGESPGLAEAYRHLMGEELGAVVLLPRVPTAEDWAAAERLASSRSR